MSSIWFLRSWSRWVDVEVIRYRCVPLYPFRGGLCGNLVDDDINGDDVDDDHVDDDGDKNRDDNVVGWWCSQLFPTRRSSCSIEPGAPVPILHLLQCLSYKYCTWQCSFTSTLVCLCFVMCDFGKSAWHQRIWAKRSEGKMSYELKVITSSSSLTNIAQGNVHFIWFRVHLFCIMNLHL